MFLIWPKTPVCADLSIPKYSPKKCELSDVVEIPEVLWYLVAYIVLGTRRDAETLMTTRRDIPG
jgi:hypothetical protein